MRLFVVVLVLLVCFSGIAVSDDGAMVHIGGNIQLMKEHPSVQLLAEHVHARIYEDYTLVECIFFLQNKGSSAVVEIGFPNYGEGSGSIPIPYEYFKSYVDGKRVEVELIETKESPSWYCKSVSFQEGELKVLRNVYKGRHGSDTWGDEWFNYVLHTGGSWQGPIGAANIVLTFEEVDIDRVFDIKPSGYQIDTKEIRWTFSNYEPSNRKDDIYVRWDGNKISEIKSDIHRLAAQGDIEGVRKLLERGIDVNTTRRIGQTPISDAIYFGAGPEMVEFLLKHGACANSDHDRELYISPLSVAVMTYERFNTPYVLEAAQLLIEFGAEVGPEYKNFIRRSEGELKNLLEEDYQKKRSN